MTSQGANSKKIRFEQDFYEAFGAKIPAAVEVAAAAGAATYVQVNIANVIDAFETWGSTGCLL